MVGKRHLVLRDASSHFEAKTATHERCLNGGQRIVRAVPSRLDDMIA
jgi:hypothetical protein